jgi:3-oxoacyl-[acyl-carrier-protein] synthase-1
VEPFKVERALTGGHAAGFALLEEAVREIRAGKIEFALVGGVDSFLPSERLADWDASWRIRTERNVDGFLPGEAAVLLLIESEDRAAGRGACLLSVIDAFGFGTEPESLLHSDRASTGKGIVDAVRCVSGGKPEGHRFGWIYSDLNGESYGAFEWGVLQTRLAKRFEGGRKLVHPADCLGDVGAATGALLLACASHAFQWKYNVTGEALLLSSSDDGARAAMTVRDPVTKGV